MNDTRIRTTIAPNLICCDGPWEAYQPAIGHAPARMATRIVWEPPTGPDDRRPTFKEVIDTLVDNDTVFIKTLCRAAGLPVSAEVALYQIVRCAMSPSDYQCGRLATLVHMAPEAIRWPIRVIESEGTAS